MKQDVMGWECGVGAGLENHLSTELTLTQSHSL